MTCTDCPAPAVLKLSRGDLCARCALAIVRRWKDATGRK
jgi:hypothetical protein